MDDADVIRFISKGGRLRRDTRVPDHLWSLLQQCWDAQYERRPTFCIIVQTLDSFLEGDEDIYMQPGQLTRTAARLQPVPAQQRKKVTEPTLPGQPITNAGGSIVYQVAQTTGQTQYEALTTRSRATGPVYACVSKPNHHMLIPFEDNQLYTVPETETDMPSLRTTHLGQETQQSLVSAGADAHQAAVWLSRSVSRSASEQFLRHAGEGTYILRQQSGEHRNLTLSVKGKLGVVSHYRIRTLGDESLQILDLPKIADRSFADLEHLLEFLKGSRQHSGLAVRLHSCLPADSTGV